MTQSSMGAQSVETTFYWYDFETFGVDPRKDRPAQFAQHRFAVLVFGHVNKVDNDDAAEIA